MTHERRKIPIEDLDTESRRAESRSHGSESKSPVSHEKVTESGVRTETATEESQAVPHEEPSPLELVAAERDGYIDALMRLQAEFENFRRRSQRELSEARNRARMGLLGEFLPVFDNLARALDAAEHHEEGKVLEGVRLTHALFADLLRREGVSEVYPLGAHFDPHLHEAIVSLPSEVDEGVVIQVVEKGYTAGDQVLRPARVAVSAGSPNPGSAVPGADEE